jgi:hypothetical protein
MFNIVFGIICGPVVALYINAGDYGWASAWVLLAILNGFVYVGAQVKAAGSK